MRYMRSLGRFLFGNVFRLCALALPPLIAFSVLFGTPTTLKRYAQESGIYQSAMTAVMDQSATSPDNTDALSQDVLGSPDIRLAVIKAFPADSLQSATENVVDGTYDWLSGTSDSPSFQVDLTEQKNSLVKNVTEHISSEASSLPTCDAAQLRELQQKMPDILNLPCLPPGLNTKTAAAQFVNDNVSSNEFLKDPVLTVDDLPKNQEGQLIHQQLSSAPIIFQWLQKGYLIALFGLVIGGASYVITSIDRRKAIRHCAYVLVITGGLLLVSVLVYWFLLDKGGQLLGGSVTNDAFRSSLNMFLLGLAKQANTIIGYAAGAYLGVGLIGLLAFRAKKPALADSTNQSVAETPTDQQVAAQVPRDSNNDEKEPQ